MNNGLLLFFGIILSVSTSFWALLLAPQLQLGSAQPVVIEATGERYPSPRPGLVQAGAEVYRAQGCVECHSQQVRQTGVTFELWLAESGSAWPQLAAAMEKLKIANPDKLITQAPVKLLGGLTMIEATGMALQLTNGEAKAQVVLATLGPDILRARASYEAMAAAATASIRREKNDPTNPDVRVIELPTGEWLHIVERRAADGGVITVGVDITPLKRKEEELAKNERRLSDALSRAETQEYRIKALAKEAHEERQKAEEASSPSRRSWPI